MKANGLIGDYCMTCASILDDVQRNHRRVIVLDSQCAAVFHQSGDAARLDQAMKTDIGTANEALKHDVPEIPAHKHKQETSEVQETVHTHAAAAKTKGVEKATRKRK